MNVRAKFRVTSITETENWNKERGPVKTIKLSPVYGNSDPNHENTKFFEATPSGAIELGCVNPDASGQFELGKEYYIDFTKAD